jgi:tRNA (adenine22-N1)-methyltransferase
MKENRTKTVLSDRLQAVADMVTPGGCVADVGCDHGFLSLYLAENRIASHVIAMDVREGPLSHARAHIAESGFDGEIELRLADGLAGLSREDAVSTVVLAGMGGRLMQRILAEPFVKGLGIRELVLAPQSEWALLRQYLRKAEYVIVQENMICEDGKFYPVIKAVAGNTDFSGVALCSTDSDKVVSCGVAAGSLAETAKNPQKKAVSQNVADAFGPLLIGQRHPVLRQYLELESEKFDRIAAQIKDGRTGQHRGGQQEEVMDETVETRRKLLREALGYFSPK